MKTAEQNTKQQKSISNTLCREDNKRNLKKKRIIFVGVECHPHSYVIFFPLKSDDKMTKDKLRFLSIYS